VDIYISVDTRKYNIYTYAVCLKFISEIGDMEHKYLNSSVHRVVSLIKVSNKNPQFQHLSGARLVEQRARALLKRWTL